MNVFEYIQSNYKLEKHEFLRILKPIFKYNKNCDFSEFLKFVKLPS